MKQLRIEGGRPLNGEVRIHGAKNSVLPILAATVLHRGVSVLDRCPRLADVETSVRILRHLGAEAHWEGNRLVVDASRAEGCDIPEELMREMRSSVVFLGALLARSGEAVVSYPGGCALGPRPIDLHLRALRALGGEIAEEGGSLSCRAAALAGTEITLDLPSVGATENAMLAAAGAAGVTTIRNAAREPEIADLQRFLRALGVRVRGAGGSAVTVEGRSSLHDAAYRVMPDRIVACTYLAAAACCGGTVRLAGAEENHLGAVLSPLREAGCGIQCDRGGVTIRSDGRLRAIRPVRTAPYPGFPTDAQAPLMAALLKSRGATVFVENMFENRYRHVDELLRMGADIRVEGRVAVVYGTEKLHGASVRCTDLRGGAALATAALLAEGESVVSGAELIDRGYEDIARDLSALGAAIRKESGEADRE